MLWEERMEEAARCRDRGNMAYKASNSAEAMTQYLMVCGVHTLALAPAHQPTDAPRHLQGLSYIDDNMMAQLFGRYLDESSDLKCALHQNAAAALLALQQHDEALGHCRAALALQPNSVKALYRKGRAHAALGQDGSAREAFNKAAALEPGDSAVRAALRDLDAEEHAKQAAQRVVFTGLFGSAPEPRAEADPVPEATAAAPPPGGAVSGLLGRWWRGSR
jgi:tetratricopeptide (TPR) repeat protein